jgi:hypothetical protein
MRLFGRFLRHRHTARFTKTKAVRTTTYVVQGLHKMKASTTASFFLRPAVL